MKNEQKDLFLSENEYSQILVFRQYTCINTGNA